jgi:hypothetical protein
MFIIRGIGDEPHRVVSDETNDSHTEQRKTLGLTETKDLNAMTHVPVEVAPPDNNYETDPMTWPVRPDIQPSEYPGWFTLADDLIDQCRREAVRVMTLRRDKSRTFVIETGNIRVFGSTVTVNGGVCDADSGSTVTVNGGWCYASFGSTVTVNGGWCDASFGSTVTVNGGWCYASFGSAVTVKGGSCYAYSGSAVTVKGGSCSAYSGSTVTVKGGSCSAYSGSVVTVKGGSCYAWSGSVVTVNGGVCDARFGSVVTGDEKLIRRF